MNEMLELLKSALWGDPAPSEPVTEEIFQELNKHAVASLISPVLPKLTMPDALRKEWKNTIFRQITHQVNCKYVQDRIAISVPYVILKGTTAAQYYPHPEFRTMGDIDLMTSHEDFETACIDLINNGYKEHIVSSTEEFGRHRVFVMNNTMIEVHSFFAMLNDPEKARYLDDLIISNIRPSHVLPDLVNGLVLLEHISQHLEEGIGLRQIIDWMMFVDKCLPDEKWPEFYALAKKIGLEALALVTTKMCETYLGLRVHSWCSNTDEALCKNLMNYVLASGNFGIKNTVDDELGARLMTYSRTPGAFFRLLQERGLVNWRATRKYAILKPFAWLYQIGRYIKNSLSRNNAMTELKTDIKEAKRRAALFDALGVKQTSKGLAIYENGRYVKTFKRP